METVLLYILGFVVVLVGILVSVALHEVGHLVPAKLFGVRVGQYMVGFGKTLWSKRYGETEYGLKLLPLGGYISMAGMYPPAKGETESRDSSTGFLQTLMQDARDQSAEGIEPGHEDRVFYKLPVWKRIIIMFGGPFMNLVIGVVLFAVVLSGFGIYQPTTTIETVPQCVLPVSSEEKECDAAADPSPAAEAGILPGDRIVSIDGVAINQWDEATAIIRASPGESLAIELDRSGERLTVSATPLVNEIAVLDEFGSPRLDDSKNLVTQEAGYLGISSSTALQQQPLTEVLPTVGNVISRVTQVIINLPKRLVDVANAAFGTAERDPNGPVGVVGVGRIAGEVTSNTENTVESRVATLLGLLAGLNISLFVFNLVPLLPLDGGHIAGALWEGIRRFFAKLFKRPDPGPVDIAKMVPLTLAVVVLLGGMSLLLLYADIFKPITLQ